jgi:hypothetical protein
MARRSKAQIELERRLHKINGEALAGHVVNIMDLGKISKAGEDAAAVGADDAGIRAAMDAVIAQVEKN